MEGVEIVEKAYEKVDTPPLKSRSVIGMINSDDEKEDLRSVARAQIARRVSPHLPAKRSRATELDGMDDAENSELIKRQIMKESKMLVDSDFEAEERVDLLRQFQTSSKAKWQASETPVGKHVYPSHPTRTQETAYQRDPSESTTDTHSEPPASLHPRQAQQALAHNGTRRPLDQFRQDKDGDDPQPHHRRYRETSRRIIYSSDEEEETDDRMNDDEDDQRFQSRLHTKPSTPLGNSRVPGDNDHKKDTLKARVLLRKFQQNLPNKAPPSNQVPASKKFLVPSSIKPLNSTSSHRLPTHTRSIPGSSVERADPSTPPTKTMRKHSVSLNNTLFSPSKSPSMTTPFPGPRPVPKKARLEV